MDLSNGIIGWIWRRPQMKLRNVIARSSESIFTHSATPIFQLTFANILLLIQYLYTVYYSVCQLIGAFIIYPNPADYGRYSFLLGSMFELKVLNHLNCICGFAGYLMQIYLDYVVHFQRFNYVWRTAGEIVSIDWVGLFRDNPRLIPEIHHGRPIQTVISIWKCAKTLWNLPPNLEIKLNPTFHLIYYPNIPAKLTIRAVFVQLVFGFTHFWALVVLGLITAVINVIVCYMNYTRLTHHTWFQQLGFQLEFLLQSYLIGKTVSHGFFIIHMFVLVSFVGISYMKTLDRQLDSAVFRFKRGQIRSNELACAVDHFRREHIIFLLDAIVSNRQLASRAYFIAGIAMFPVNLYFVAMAYFMNLGMIDRSINLAMFFAQVLFLCLSLVPMIRIADCLYFPCKKLFTVQQFLHNTLRIKLKLLFYLEANYCKQRFTYTMGAVGKIRQRSILQAFLFYSGYLMFVFAIFQNTNSKRKWIN